jgi:hypothetical protein
MANENPDLYVIRVNAQPVESPTSKRTLAGALTFDVSRRGDCGKGRAAKVDLCSLVVRPGDSITFELGDIAFENKSAELRLSWKFPTGKRWGGAPRRAGKVAQIPPGKKFGGNKVSFHAQIDLNTKLRLPAETKSRRGTTVIQLDPDIIIDEC